MKVLFDSQIFVQGAGGASRYYVELIEQLKQTKGVDADLSLLYSNNYYLADSQFGKGKYALPNNSGDINQFLPGLNFRGKGKLFKTYSKFTKQLDIGGLNRAEDIRQLEAQDFDLFHPTYYDPYFLKHIGSKPFVYTILDMNHELYSEYFQAKDMLAITERKATLAHKATKIIAISERTKQDAVEILGINPDKVTVVHLASSISKIKAHTELAFPKKYLLYVGHRWIYKNFFLFARALAPLMLKDPELNLVCIGGGAFNSTEQEFLSSLGIADRVVRYDADEPSLVYAYEHALAFVYPSLYEGFGVPIIEAFESGCPVIASNASCFPEVGGDAAEYFEPKSFKSIQTTLQKVIDNSELRAQMIKRGKERAKLFSWEKMTEQTLAVYQSALNG